MHIHIRVALCLIITCYVIAVAADTAHAQPLQARFAIPPDAERLLNESSTLFQDAVRKQLGDVLNLQKIRSINSRTIRADLDSNSIDIAVLPASTFPGPIGEYVTGFDIAGRRQRQESEVGAYQLAQLEKEGLVGLSFWNAPPRQFVLRDQINKLEDLKGKKIVAFSGPTWEIFNQIGAAPINLPAGEVFAALDRGLVDAAEVPPGLELATTVPSGVFKSVIVDVPGATEFLFVARKGFWTLLSYRAQVELAKAARAAARRSDRISQINTRSALQTLSTQGTSLVSFTPEDKGSLRRAAFSAWSRLAGDQSIDVLARAYAVTSEDVVRDPGPKRDSAQRRHVFFATVRAFENEKMIEYQFGNRRKDKGLNYGRACVLLKAGRNLDDDLESVATIERLERFASDAVFKSEMKAAPGFAANVGILVFVHGYNNSFLDAVRRAAQFAVDVGFDGPIIVFSWPSDGSTLLYFHDEDRVQATRLGFTEFFEVVESLRPRANINILAHSMGTRVVLNYTTTLQERGNAAAKGKYRSLTLAASDTPIEVLRVQKDFLSEIASIISIYFSENDRALWLSNELHRVARLGNIAGDKLFLDPESDTLGSAGFDFIDAAQIDKAFFTFSPRHGYIFQKAPGVTDMKALLIKGMSANKRSAENPAAVVAKENKGNRFWALNP